MRREVKLPNIHYVALILEHGRFIVVDIEVVGSGKDGHYGGESSRFGFAVHAITSILSFVRSNDGEEVVTFEELGGGLVADETESVVNKRRSKNGDGGMDDVREEIGTSTDVIVNKALAGLFQPKIFDWI